MNKKKVILICVNVLAIIVAFACGFVVGKCSKCDKNQKTKSKFVQFYTVKKNNGQVLNTDEKRVIKMFTNTYEECLTSDLNSQEKKKLSKIENEVLSLVKNNNKVKYKITDLKNGSNSKSLLKKVNKCRDVAYKHITKADRRVMRTAISKMDVKNIISMFHGIK